MAEQEAQWKEAYDVLLAENTALKSSGSEALLAAQWRQRYESCMAEKETLKTQLQTAQQKKELDSGADAGKYEMKYRDLKESFRLYRKKAKEIFEAQQNGDVSVSSVQSKKVIIIECVVKIGKYRLTMQFAYNICIIP